MSYNTPTGIPPFTLLFPTLQNPYPKTRLSTITTNRTTHGGTLLFDRLLAIAALPPSSYPPRSLSQLQALITEIYTLPTLDTLKKHSLAYYLILDSFTLDAAPTSAAADYADRFRRGVLLPDAYVDLMRGVWSLDNLRLADAVRHLCTPGVTVPAPEHVLRVLSAAGRGDLVLAFVDATQTALTADGAGAYFDALASASPGAALLWARGREAGEREGCVKRLVQSAVETGGERVLEVLGLPMDALEKEWAEGVLTAMGGRAREALVVWWMQTGRYADALRTMGGAEMDADGEGKEWAVLAEGVRKGLGPRLEA
ncbi:nuclear pore complex assembly-domain-containing protein [Geopyxis carbonaria]|nr:nuclear pore complex assembly-domain-containing protein [Geopyxis carbonaria]